MRIYVVDVENLERNGIMTFEGSSPSGDQKEPSFERIINSSEILVDAMHDEVWQLRFPIEKQQKIVTKERMRIHFCRLEEQLK